MSTQEVQPDANADSFWGAIPPGDDNRWQIDKHLREIKRERFKVAQLCPEIDAEIAFLQGELEELQRRRKVVVGAMEDGIEERERIVKDYHRAMYELNPEEYTSIKLANGTLTSRRNGNPALDIEDPAALYAWAKANDLLETIGTWTPGKKLLKETFEQRPTAGVLTRGEDEIVPGVTFESARNFAIEL